MGHGCNFHVIIFDYIYIYIYLAHENGYFHVSPPLDPSLNILTFLLSVINLVSTYLGQSYFCVEGKDTKWSSQKKGFNEIEDIKGSLEKQAYRSNLS